MTRRPLWAHSGQCAGSGLVLNREETISVMINEWMASNTGYTNNPAWGRAKVALAFYQSMESRLKRVDVLYQALLGRGPDSVGWPYWAQTVLSSGDITLAINLADSAEYWMRASTRY